MADEPKDTYGIESSSGGAGGRTGADADEGGAAPGAPRAGRPIEPGAGPREPLPLEPDGDDEVPMAMRSVKDLDVCPNCGASMTNADDVVCLRCGFDLKTMKQVRTATGEVEVKRAGAPADDDCDESAASAADRKPLVVPGMGGTKAPLIAAAIAGAILVLGCLAGISGLFPPVVNAQGQVTPGAEITFAMRMTGLVKLLISAAMWTGCGLGSLTFLAYLNGLRLGDLRLAAARTLGIVAIMHLAKFMNFGSAWVEWTLEAVVQAGVFAALSMVVFNLKPKDAPVLVGGAIILFLAIWVTALAVAWGAG